MAVTWRYFTNSDYRTTRAWRLLRLRDDEPLLLAESVGDDGRWHLDDALFRERMLGSSDTHVEIDEAEARRLRGDRPWTDRSADRPGPLRRAHLTRREKAIADRWAQVPTPPGAADLEL